MILEQISNQHVRLSEYRDARPWGYLLKRFLWSCVQILFWTKLPRKLSPLRVGLLRLFGAQIAPNCRIESARIWVPWNLCMEEYSVIGNGAEIYNLAQVKIGANSIVSQRSYLCTATHDYTKPEFPLYSRPITIGPNAWVAACAFIGPGVTVGEGAVVGACSVVVKDVSPWTVCAGNPCRVIKSRRLKDLVEPRRWIRAEG
jgi:putative colanic acid biosynthesis acetyltransferase WcaF